MPVHKLTICVAYIALRCVNSRRIALRMKATGGLFYAYAMRSIDFQTTFQDTYRIIIFTSIGHMHLKY